MSDFKAKCTILYFGWGSIQDPTGGAYSAPPDPLAGFKGPASKRREGQQRKGKGGEGWNGRRWDGGWKGREGGNVEFHHLLL